MKIDKIEICNLASIEGEQQIDFTEEPLRSAGLFAITGKTGAGKSTVLDAICLALYNEAPRLGNKERGAYAADDEGLNAYSPANMLRRGATQGYSRITFSTGDGTQYQARWTVGLTRNGTHRPVQRELVQFKPKHTVLADKNTEVQAAIKDIVGLDYSQFTRTVILAQNSFANFLSAKRGEKSQLLEKITGTEIYARISRNIFELTKAAEQQYNGAKEYMEGLSKGAMAEQDLRQAEENLRLRNSQLGRSKDDLALILRQIEWMEQYAQAQADYEQKNAELQQARSAYNQLYDLQRDLERYDQLQPFAKTYSNICQTRENIDRLKSEAAAKEAEAEQQSREVEIRHSRYSEASDSLLAARQNMSIQQPNINRGRQIQGKLSVQQDNLRTTLDDIAHDDDELRQRADTRSSKEAEIRDCTQRLNSAKQTMQTMQQHQAMVAQMEYVRTHLQKMHELRNAIREQEKKIEEHSKNLAQAKALALTEQEKFHNLQGEVTRLKGELLVHEQANKGLTSHEIQTRLARLADTAMRSGNAINLWARIDRRFTKLSDKADELRRRTMLHRQQADEIKNAKIQEEKFTYAYNAIHQNYTLSQSEDVANMRQALKEGMACPLCGSTHHPYHTDTAQQLNDFLHNLTEQHQRAYDDMMAAEQALKALQQAYDTEQGQLSVEADMLANLKQEQQEDIKAWQQFADLDPSFAQCDENVNRGNRSTMLHQIHDSATREHDVVKQKLDEFTRHQDSINRINAIMKDVQQQIADNSAQQTEINARMQILSSQITSCQQEMEDNKRKSGREIALIEPLITITGWRERWEESYEAFDNELSTIRTKWDDNAAILNKEQDNLFRLNQELTTLNRSEEDLQRNRQELMSRAEVMRQEISRQESELKTLFGDSTVDKEAYRLDMALKTAEREVEETMQKYNEVRNSFDNIRAQIRTLRQQAEQQEEAHRQMRTELDIEISRFNNGKDSTLQYFELDKYFSTPQRWQQVRHNIEEHRKRMDTEQLRTEAAAQALAKLEASLSRPAADDENRALLSDRKEQLQSQIEECEKERARLEFAVKTHRESLQNMNFYRPTLEKAEANWHEWKELCDVLGSADGNAFRAIAQCYTFEFLVDFANVQLADLTSRYRLRSRRDTLQLDVIDRHMLDQVRAVNSLSGGETFIVSLSLALGLSALSSNNLEIGSLFIDEGFGNLDNENLNMVIDALSNLPNTQRRKVGVISHTELIQSRISPKICLVPHSGGRSTITVKG